MIIAWATIEAAFQLMNQRNIGILVTNTDNSRFALGWTRDGEKFTTLIRSARPGWSVQVYDCTKGEFPHDVDANDGYVIGGSPASVNDADMWIGQAFDFIRSLHAARKPAVGCCFGHQAMAVALGGLVGDNPGGWGFGVSPTHFTAQEEWMSPPSPTLQLFAAHSEQVTRVPDGGKIIGGDEFCPTAAMTVGSHFISTQYHPEMTKPFFIALTRAFEDEIGRDVAEAARKQAETIETDSLQFAHWMARFLEMPRANG